MVFQYMSPGTHAASIDVSLPSIDNCECFRGLRSMGYKNETVVNEIHGLQQLFSPKKHTISDAVSRYMHTIPGDSMYSPSCHSKILCSPGGMLVNMRMSRSKYRAQTWKMKAMPCTGNSIRFGGLLLVALQLHKATRGKTRQSQRCSQFQWSTTITNSTDELDGQDNKIGHHAWSARCHFMHHVQLI